MPKLAPLRSLAVKSFGTTFTPLPLLTSASGVLAASFMPVNPEALRVSLYAPPVRSAIWKFDRVSTWVPVSTPPLMVSCVLVNTMLASIVSTKVL